MDVQLLLLEKAKWLRDATAAEPHQNEQHGAAGNEFTGRVRVSLRVSMFANGSSPLWLLCDGLRLVARSSR